MKKGEGEGGGTPPSLSKSVNLVSLSQKYVPRGFHCKIPYKYTTICIVRFTSIIEVGGGGGGGGGGETAQVPIFHAQLTFWR